MPPSVPAGRPPLPTDAARLDVAPTARLAWTARAALPTRGVVTIAVLGVLPLVVIGVLGPWWLLLVAVGLTILLSVAYSARVVIDATGLRVVGLGFTWGAARIESVASAEVGQVFPMREFGGWGWRLALDGRRGFVTRQGEALVVHRIGETDLVVTVDDADEAAAVLNTLASRVS